MYEDDESYAIGHKFETYLESMFVRSGFKILLRPDEWGSTVPDFYVRAAGRPKFWVEAKYRNRLIDDKYDVCLKDPHRLKTWHIFQEVVRPEPVYMVLGLGGDPTRPEKTYCLDLQLVKNPGMYHSTLRDNVHESETFKFEKGRLS